MSKNQIMNSTTAISFIEKVTLYFVNIDVINRKLFFNYNSMKSIKKRTNIMKLKESYMDL